LRGVEDSDLASPEDTSDGAAPVVKAFVVSRMSDVVVDRPGTGRRVPPVRHVGLHPMSWEIDPPVEVRLQAPAQFEADVRRWLGEPVAVEAAESDGVPDMDAAVVLRYLVTHRAALRARLFELGDRVQVLGPAEVRAELIAALDAARGEGMV
ncbi:MAG: WYL domain-containing protein, partial [Nocardioidaceae bacterium]|nr:WYL domain-containing protein [Nocardioidaceae bacterium]